MLTVRLPKGRCRTAGRLLAVAFLLNAFVFWPAAEAWADLTNQQLLDNLRTFLSPPDSGSRQAALQQLLSVGPAGVGRLEFALASGSVYLPRPTGFIDRKVHLNLNGTDVDYVLCVPQDYKPDRSYPLFLVLYGGGRQSADRWLRHLNPSEVIVASSAWNGGPYGATELERQIPLALVRDVRRDYHVDSNRVYLTGVSRGGHATWDSLLTYTDFYAGGIAEAGVPLVEAYQVARALFYPNLDGAGIYVMQGTPDQDAPEINRAAVDQLKRLGMDAVYVEFPGAGHGSYDAGSDAAVKWLWDHKRRPWPVKITKIAHRLRDAHAWWVKVDQMKGPEWDPNKRIEVHVSGKPPKDELMRLAEKEIDKELIHVKAEVKSDNRLVITCAKVARLTVQLHPDIVDFAKPVRIVVNGQIAFQGMVHPDPKVLLDAAADRFDFQRLPYAEVSVPVP